MPTSSNYDPSVKSSRLHSSPEPAHIAPKTCVDMGNPRITHGRRRRSVMQRQRCLCFPFELPNSDIQRISNHRLGTPSWAEPWLSSAASCCSRAKTTMQQTEAKQRPRQRVPAGTHAPRSLEHLSPEQEAYLGRSIPAAKASGEERPSLGNNNTFCQNRARPRTSIFPTPSVVRRVGACPGPLPPLVPALPWQSSVCW